MANPISGDCLERFQPAQVGIKEAQVLYPLQPLFGRRVGLLTRLFLCP